MSEVERGEHPLLSQGLPAWLADVPIEDTWVVRVGDFKEIFDRQNLEQLLKKTLRRLPENQDSPNF